MVILNPATLTMMINCYKTAKAVDLGDILNHRVCGIGTLGVGMIILHLLASVTKDAMKQDQG